MLCPRCGAPATPADKFCAVCASPLAPSGPGAFGAPPPPPPPPPPFPAPGFGAPPEPPPNYGSPSGGFGPPPPAPFGAPPGSPPGFPPAPDGGPAGFGPPPPFGPQPGGYGAPQPPPPVPLKPPPFPPEPPIYGAPGGGYGSAPSFPEQQQGSYPGPPLPRPGFGPPPQPGFGPPPQPQGARCVQGHAIPAGGSFCMEGGHPIALDGIQMSGDPFNQTAYAPNQQGASAPPPMPQASGSGAYGEPPQPQQNLAPPGPPPAYIPPPPAVRAPTPAPPRAVGQESRRALAGFLVSFQDDALGRFWPLWQGKNIVGRAETGQKVDIEIAHGTTSTHHAMLEVDGGRIVLADLGSTNGTFHNEEAIGFQGRRELRDGDKIRFGGFSVILLSVAARA
ncbi:MULTISPECIES: FHA domain-containing protein [Sorangium]|uniref:FHA domain-containing protein n=1 Tax=Sorangium atrum TaxID=2995308 RepID=A0ABT5CHX1_9BACT|nr:FHA domain-containing protein [Sorangium aterium]MDC0685238.1 FHA domain-containing protein [Sorangium aterium]